MPLNNVNLTQPRNDWMKIGTLIKNVTDRGGLPAATWEIHTAIESIRFDCSDNNPRLEINTAFPQIPAFKKMANDASLGVVGGVNFGAQLSTGQNYTSTGNKTQVNGVNNPVIGGTYKIGGAGGVAVPSSINIYEVIGGNLVAFGSSNINGIKWNNNAITGLVGDVSAYTSDQLKLLPTLPDGIGYAKKIDGSGAYVLVGNWKGFSTYGQDLLEGQSFISTTTTNISANDGSLSVISPSNKAS
jgi:hypothetical protein